MLDDATDLENPPADKSFVLFDATQAAAHIDALAEKHAGADAQFRTAVATLLKSEMTKARALAEQQLWS